MGSTTIDVNRAMKLTARLAGTVASRPRDRWDFEHLAQRSIGVLTVDHDGAGSVSASCHFMARAWRMGAMRRMTSPFWNSRTVPLDWLTTTATALVTSVIAAAAQWRVPRPLGRVSPRHRRVDQAAGGFDRAVAGHDEGTVELGDLLDRLAHAEVADVALLAKVALERVEPQLAGPGHHVAGIADDDQRADGLSLAALAADLDGDVDDRLQGLERDRRLERPQVARGEPLEVFAQPDDAQASRAPRPRNPSKPPRPARRPEACRWRPPRSGPG